MRENVLKEIGDKEKNDDSKVMQGKLIKKQDKKKKESREVGQIKRKKNGERR